MGTTRISRHIDAPSGKVYRALLDPDAIAQWMVPDGMTSRVHQFEAREGGEFRISLTYTMPTTAGKTSAQTDTYHGRFVKLVPDAEVVQRVEFETDDAQMQGEMTIRYTLTDTGRGTDLVGVHENLPPGVPPADNELGWRMSIDKLARLVETDVTSANKQTVEKYIDGFNRSDHEQILSCLTDDIQWTVFGAFQLTGKEAYDEEIENPAFTGSPKIAITRMVEEDDVVMAEMTLEARRASGEVMRVAMGEVFVMRDGKINERRAYVVELKENDYK